MPSDNATEKPSKMYISFQRIFIVSMMFFSLIIAGAATFALGFEISHLVSYKSHGSYEDSTLNYDTAACRHARQQQQSTPYPDQNSTEQWEQMVSIWRCTLLSSPELENVVKELENYVATNKHSANVSSSLGTLVALISLVFTAVAWFTSKWVLNLMKYSEEAEVVKQKINNLEIEAQKVNDENQSNISGFNDSLHSMLNKIEEKNARITVIEKNIEQSAESAKEQTKEANNLLQRLRGREEINNRLIAVQHEIIDFSCKVSKKSLAKATEIALGYRLYLDYLTLSAPEQYENAARILGPFYLSVGNESGYEFRYFREFLKLCQQQYQAEHGEEHEFLTEAFYFGGCKS